MVWSQNNNWMLLRLKYYTMLKCYTQTGSRWTHIAQALITCSQTYIYIDHKFKNKTTLTKQSLAILTTIQKHKSHKRTTICCSKGVQTLNGPEQSHTHEHKIYAPNHLKHQMVQNTHKLHDYNWDGWYSQMLYNTPKSSHPCVLGCRLPENTPQEFGRKCSQLKCFEAHREIDSQEKHKN